MKCDLQPHQALFDRPGGNPTKSCLQRLCLTSLLGICHDLGLLGNGSEGKPSKRLCVERIMLHMQEHQGLNSVSLLYPISTLFEAGDIYRSPIKTTSIWNHTRSKVP